MKYYAKVVNGIVENVIVAEESLFDSLVDNEPAEYIETFRDGSQKKNYAGIGYHYDGIGFYAPQPYSSWTLNSTSYLWEPPVAHPNDGKIYEWNETDKQWNLIE